MRGLILAIRGQPGRLRQLFEFDSIRAWRPKLRAGLETKGGAVCHVHMSVPYRVSNIQGGRNGAFRVGKMDGLSSYKQSSFRRRGNYPAEKASGRRLASP
ncbi:MAG: hypothetical protein ACK55I_04980 [bacterium]